MSDSEPVSLEFIEDPYLPKLDDITTPSLDTWGALDWNDETDLYLRNLTLDQIFYDTDSDYSNQLELQAVETEFIISKLANQTPSMSIAKRFRLKFFAKRTMRDVKVTFVDFSKPYIAKISSSENYKKFLNIGSPAACAKTTKGKVMNMKGEKCDSDKLLVKQINRKPKLEWKNLNTNLSDFKFRIEN